MTIYKDLTLDSIKIIKKNLILFIPDLILLFSTILISIIALLVTGLLPKVLVNPSMIYDITTAKDVLTGFFSTSGNIIRTVVSLILFVIVLFFVGAGLMAVKYSMIKQILDKKKITFKGSSSLATNFFWRIIILKVYLFLIIAVPIFLVFLLISFLFYLSNTITITIGSILGVLAVIFLVLTVLAFLFRYPILILDNASPIKSLKNSLKFFKKNIKYVIMCEVLIIILTTLFGLLFNLPINYLQTLFESIYIFLFLVILRRAIQIIPTLWTEIFIFLAYKKKIK